MKLTDIAESILEGEALLARSHVQDWLSSGPDLASEPLPDTADVRVLALSAALVELFAERLGQHSPDWTKQVLPLHEPVYLLRSAEQMPRLRRLCEEQSPPPLRRRNLFAPADYLTFA